MNPGELNCRVTLLAEVKTADGGLRDWRHRYTWYNPDATVNGGMLAIRMPMR